LRQPAYEGTGGRKHALIVAAAVIAGSLALSGMAVALDRTLRPGEESGSGAQLGDSGQKGRATTAPTTEPTTAPSTSASAEPPQSSEEVRRVTSALGDAGYACYESLTKPVVVHSCYLDPGTRSLDHQTVRIRTAEDGSVAAIELRISYFDGTAPALDLFRRTVEALGGTVLTTGEARAVVDGRTKDEVPASPGSHSTVRLDWGASELFVSERLDAYYLTLVAHGAKPRVVPDGDTKTGIVETRDHYKAQGFRCTLDEALQTLKCQRRVSGAIYTVLAVDPCLGRGKKYELVCQGHKASEVRASVGFDADLPEKSFEELVSFLLESADQSMGGMAVDTRGWLLKSISDAKVHRADFQGMHLAFEPGAGVDEGFPNVVSVEVRGATASS